jgi:hypothetical protein
MNDGFWEILGYDILLCRFFGHSQMPFLFSSSSHFDGLFMNIFSFYSHSLAILFFLFDHQRHFTSPGFLHRSSLLFAVTADRLHICLF